MVNMDSYLKVKNLFAKNKETNYTANAIRVLLILDYGSVKEILKQLIKEKHITKSTITRRGRKYHGYKLNAMARND